MREYLEKIAHKKIELGNNIEYILQTKVGVLRVIYSNDSQKYYDSFFSGDFNKEKFEQLTKITTLNPYTKKWRIPNIQVLMKIL